MYLPNTVGKRYKKAFKLIFGDRNLRLREGGGPNSVTSCVFGFAFCDYWEAFAQAKPA